MDKPAAEREVLLTEARLSRTPAGALIKYKGAIGNAAGSIPRSSIRAWRITFAPTLSMNLSWRGEFDSLAHHIDHHFTAKSK